MPREGPAEIAAESAGPGSSAAGLGGLRLGAPAQEVRRNPIDQCWGSIRGRGEQAVDDLTALLRERGVTTVPAVPLRTDRATLGAYAKARTPDKGIEKLMRDAGLGCVSPVSL